MPSSKNQTGQDIGVQSNVTREVEYSHVGAEEPTRVEGGPADKVFDPGVGEPMKGEISLLKDGQYLEEPGLVGCYASIRYDVRGHLPVGNNHIHQVVVLARTVNCCGGTLVVGEIKVGKIANNIALTTLMSGDREWSVASTYTDCSHVRSEVAYKESNCDVATEVSLIEILSEILVIDSGSCVVAYFCRRDGSKSNGGNGMESTFLLNEEISCEAERLALIRAMFDPGGQLAGDIN